MTTNLIAAQLVAEGRALRGQPVISTLANSLVDVKGRLALRVNADGTITLGAALGDSVIVANSSFSGTLGVTGISTFGDKLKPAANDGAPLGDTTHNFSDLFLATGAVLNYANGNVVLTHTSGVLTLGTGNLIITTAGTASGSVVTTTGTQTLSAKTVVTPVISTGLTASGSTANDFSASTGTFLTSTGLTTISGGLVGATAALSGAGAVGLTTLTTKLTTTGGSQALTLANGTDGQIKTIIHDVDGGSAILTPTTKTGFTTITFTAVGETATLQYATTRGWFILALNGAVAA